MAIDYKKNPPVDDFMADVMDLLGDDALGDEAKDEWHGCAPQRQNNRRGYSVYRGNEDFIFEVRLDGVLHVAERRTCVHVALALRVSQGRVQNVRWRKEMKKREGRRGGRRRSQQVVSTRKCPTTLLVVPRTQCVVGASRKKEDEEENRRPERLCESGEVLR